MYRYLQKKLTISINRSSVHDLHIFPRRIKRRTPALTSPSVPSSPTASTGIVETSYTLTVSSLMVPVVTLNSMKVLHARPLHSLAPPLNQSSALPKRLLAELVIAHAR